MELIPVEESEQVLMPILVISCLPPF